MGKDEDKVQVKNFFIEAKTKLALARKNLDQEIFSNSLSLAYYTVFNSINALLASEGIYQNKHIDVFNEFQENFIDTGKIEEKFCVFYQQLMDKLDLAEKDPDYKISKNEAVENFYSADLFFRTVEEWLQNNYW